MPPGIKYGVSPTSSARRRLRSGVINPAPPPILPGMWLKGDTNVGVNGSVISLWVDSSGNGVDAVGSGAGLVAKPTIAASFRNGKNVVRFDGPTNVQFFALPDFLSGFTSGTVMWVAKVRNFPTSIGFDAGIIKFGTDAGINGNNHYGFSGDNFVYDDFGQSARSQLANPGAALSDWHLFSMQADQPVSNWTAYLNGSLFWTFSNAVAWTFTATPFIGQGARVAETGNHLDAWLAEIMFWPSSLSTPDREAAEAYFTTRWGPF